MPCNISTVTTASPAASPWQKKPLTESEKGLIEAYKNQKVSLLEIEKRLGRHRNTISAFLQRKLSKEPAKRWKGFEGLSRIKEK